MAQMTDLYTVLLTYTNKQHSAYVDIEQFFSFLGRHIDGRPEWRKWLAGTNTGFWEELAPLEEAERCKVFKNRQGTGRIIFIDYFIELITKSYKNMADLEVPYPDESSLKITIPQDLLRTVVVEEELGDYLDNPQLGQLPIIQLTFNDKLPPILVLAQHIPHLLLETALLKIQAYMGIHNNRDYFQNKLISQLRGKEPLIKQLMSQVEQQPQDCLRTMEDPGEFTSLCWAYLYSLIKGEVSKKHDLLPEDIIAYQSSCIIHICVTFYKKKGTKKRDRELALKTLESHLEKPPYRFKMKDIIDFTDGSGHLLLELYSEQDLQSFIKARTTEGIGGELPPLLIFHDRNKEQMFVSKTKILPLCMGLLNSARPQIQKAISKRWYKLIQDYQSEPAMEKDDEFEKLLRQYMEQFAPLLISFLDDSKLPVVQAESEYIQGSLPPEYKFYERGALLPLENLLMIRRKEILADSKSLLPFWYSVPFVSKITAFFSKLKKKSDKRDSRASADRPGKGEGGDGREPFQLKPKPAAPDKQTKALIMQYEDELIPSGYTIEDYLEALENKWRKLVNKDAQKEMAEDIRKLVKDRLLRTLRLQQSRKLTKKAIDSLANAIVFETASLQHLDDPESLSTYIRLLIINILSEMK
jgi:hypothetical protein